MTEKILITGAGGFLGSLLSEKLKDKCHGCDVEKLKKNSEFLKTQF